MIVPSPDGMTRAMRAALEDAGVAIDYINTHATSTPAGDLIELEAIREVFGSQIPLISSTKGLTGHAIGASGVHEVIYSLLMMQKGFVAACANLQSPDPAAQSYPLVTRCVERSLQSVMSNSLGFGGTNACLIFRNWQSETDLRHDA